MKKKSKFMDRFRSRSPSSTRLDIRKRDEPVVPLTEEGVLVAEDLQISKEGMKIGPAQGDSTFKLEDMEDLSVILGSGASGTVKKMKHKPTGTLVAVKVVAFDVTPEIRSKLFLELRTLHNSRHPSIVSFYGAFYEEGAISIALEYMDGSLADLIGVTPIPEPILCNITLQILEGLCYLHKQLHLVHRDIKPANILVNSEGQVKIADFGVGCKLQETLGVADSFVGTVTYMDPGRISGQPHTTNSDVWSLGLTIMECALGYYPYTPPGQNSNPSFFELHERIVEQPPPTLPTDTFGEDFCNFISICLCKNTTRRPYAPDLLKHPWIAQCSVDGLEVSTFISRGLLKAKALTKERS